MRSVTYQTKAPLVLADFLADVSWLFAWAYCDRQGNVKASSQIRVNLKDRTSAQNKATQGDACKLLVEKAVKFGCPITTEKRDKSQKKSTILERETQYSRMLSNFNSSLDSSGF